MARAAALLLAVLAAATPAAAWGTTPVASTLELAEGLRLEGDVRWSAEDGVLDLAPALLVGESPTLRLTRASGWRVDATDEGRVELRFRTAVANRSLDLGPGDLTIERCWEPCVAILVLHQGAPVRAEGAAAGWVAWTASTREYWALMKKSDGVEGSAYAYRSLAPGALGVSGGRPEDGLHLGAARFHLEGGFDLLLHNVTARWGGAERADLDTRPTREPLLGLTGNPAERWTQAFVWLGAEGALSSTSAAVLYAPAPDVTLDGRLVAPSAAGSFRHGQNATALDGERLDATGRFSLSLRAEPGTVVPLAGGAPTLHAQISGEATLLHAGGVRVRDAAGEIVAQVPLFFLALAALVLLLRFALAAPLYSRLDRAQVLASPTRSRILEILRAEPGLTTEAIARKMRLVRTTAVHHVKILQAHGLVVGHKSGRATRLYPPELAPRVGEAAARALLADPSRKEVALALVTKPQATPREIAAHTGLSRRLVAYHLARLRAEGLVESRGWPRRFQASPTMRTLVAPREPSSAPESAAS